MSTENIEVQKPTKPSKPKGVPIGRLTLPQVDAALADCDKTVKAHSDTVKVKLTNNASIPSNVLRELSRANSMRGRLVMRRIALLIESGDGAVTELLDKLMRFKPAKSI